MGLDITHQAIPYDQKIIDRIINDPGFASEMIYLGSYDQDDHGSFEEYFEDLSVLEIVRLNPDLVNFRLYFRSWDEISYLLSAQYRADPIGSALCEPDVQGIRGGKKLVDSITILRPRDIEKIASCYNSISNDQFFKFFNPKEMFKWGV